MPEELTPEEREKFAAWLRKQAAEYRHSAEGLRMVKAAHDAARAYSKSAAQMIAVAHEIDVIGKMSNDA